MELPSWQANFDLFRREAWDREADQKKIKGLYFLIILYYYFSA